jgi:hypothetical protein
MVYNSKHEIANVLDIVRHLTYYHLLLIGQEDMCDSEIYNRSNLALYEKKDDKFVEVEYFTQQQFKIQKCELELIELVRNVDVSTYRNSFKDDDETFLNTDYEKMYDDDTTEVFFKAYIIATAQLFQEKLNITFDEALIACTKVDIYDFYMQAETVEAIVKYAIENKFV